MFSDPQFWVAVSFFLFIAAIFNPVRKVLKSNLDGQIEEIKNTIQEAENVKNDAQKTLSELLKRESEVENEINVLKSNSEKKIVELKNLSSKKLDEQIERRKVLADNKIKQISRDANISIKNYIANAAIDTTIHVLKNKLSTQKKSQLINESINELNSVLKN